MADTAEPVPQKKDNPREGVDYEPDAPDYRGQVLSVWDILLSAYFVASGAVAIVEFDREGDESWKVPVVGVILWIYAFLVFTDSLIFTKKLDRWLPFLDTFFGRGFTHILAGAASVIEDEDVFLYLPLVPILTGGIYVLISCISRTMIPLPLLRREAAIDNYSESHPGYKDELARYNRKKCQKKWNKEYKKQCKEYRERMNAANNQNQGDTNPMADQENSDTTSGATGV